MIRESTVFFCSDEKARTLRGRRLGSESLNHACSFHPFPRSVAPLHVFFFHVTPHVHFGPLEWKAHREREACVRGAQERGAWGTQNSRTHVMVRWVSSSPRGGIWRLRRGEGGTEYGEPVLHFSINNEIEESKRKSWKWEKKRVKRKYTESVTSKKKKKNTYIYIYLSVFPHTIGSEHRLDHVVNCLQIEPTRQHSKTWKKGTKESIKKNVYL